MSRHKEIVTYVDNAVALSGRAYDLQGGILGLLVTEGGASFEDIIAKGG